MELLNKLLLKIANHWARRSCTRWNRAKFKLVLRGHEIYPTKLFHRVSRRLNRKLYQFMAEHVYKHKEYKRAIKACKSGEYYIDTYPPLYKEVGFAPWEEDDNTDTYTLISDPSKCIIKYATSYCAHMIRLFTGIWPQRKIRARYDAHSWQEFLRQAGYSQEVTVFERGCHYVGISDDVEKWGEYGFVCWLEKPSGRRDLRTVVSSYVDKHYWVGEVNPAEFKWIKITPKSRAKRRGFLFRYSGYSSIIGAYLSPNLSSA